jgi:hypothetical protein
MINDPKKMSMHIPASVNREKDFCAISNQAFLPDKLFEMGYHLLRFFRSRNFTISPTTTETAHSALPRREAEFRKEPGTVCAI